MTTNHKGDKKIQKIKIKKINKNIEKQNMNKNKK